MVRTRILSRVSPLRSKRLMISPMRAPRRTPVGLDHDEGALLRHGRQGYPASSEGARRLECPPYLTGDVDGAGDEHSPSEPAFWRATSRADHGSPPASTGTWTILATRAATSDAGRGRSPDAAVVTTASTRSDMWPIIASRSLSPITPHYEDEAGSWGTPSESERFSAAKPPGLWAPSSITSGSRGDYLHAAGSGEAGDRLPDRLLVEPPPQQCFHRRHGNGGVVRLVTAVHRQQQVGVVGLGAVDVHVPSRERRAGRRRRSPVRRHGVRCRGRGAVAAAISTTGSGRSPVTRIDPGPAMASFSTAICSTVVPRYSVCSRSTPGEDGHVGVDDVGGIQATAQAHLDHRRVDRLIGEEGEGRRSRQLEIREPDPLVALLEDVGESRHVGHRLGELLGCGVAAQDAEPFFDRFEMGGYVRPGVQPVGEQEQSRHPCRRRLAVRAGDVDDRISLVRRAHRLDEQPDPLQPGLHSPRRCGRPDRRVLRSNPCEPTEITRRSNYDERGPGITPGPLSLGHF